MRLESKTHLEDVRRAAVAIGHLAGGLSRESYLLDETTQGAVKYNFIMIAEALNRLLRSDPGTASRIANIEQIVAFRNRLVHLYDRVDESVVWDTIQGPLPRLLREVNALLAEPDDPV